MTPLWRLGTAIGKIVQSGFGLPDVVGMIEFSDEARRAFQELRGIPDDELSKAISKHLNAYLASGRRDLAGQNEYESATLEVARLMENQEVSQAAALEAIQRPEGLTEFLRARPAVMAIRESLAAGVEPYFDDTLGVVARVLTEIAPTNPQMQQYGVRAMLDKQDDISQRLGAVETLLRQGPEGLQEHLWLAEDVRVSRNEHFVGRTFVFNAIEERLRQGKDGEAGYLLVRGQPGIGKSAVMSQFVRQRGCVFHFNVRSAGVTSPRRMLLNLSAQLILRYRLPYQRLPADAGLDASWLSRMLREASAKAASDGAWPVVLVVDALDETDAAVGGENRLKLPRDLPEGVVVIATIRDNVADELDVAHRFEPVVLRADDPRNLDDVRLFVTEALERSAELTRRSREWALTPREFCKQIAERSDGNFMYVVQVLGGIADGVITPAIWGDTLPAGLADYYRRHWRLMHSQNTDWFERVQRPVVCMLAVAPYPLSAATIRQWITDSGQFNAVTDRDVNRVLREWQQFLVSEPGPPPAWRLYHRSFADFLSSADADDVDLDDYRRASVAATRAKIDEDA